MSEGVALGGRALIAWIDFVMPEKTHKEKCREAAPLLV
jgi:hypothetical protein